MSLKLLYEMSLLFHDYDSLVKEMSLRFVIVRHSTSQYSIWLLLSSIVSFSIHYRLDYLLFRTIDLWMNEVSNSLCSHLLLPSREQLLNTWRMKRPIPTSSISRLESYRIEVNR